MARKRFTHEQIVAILREAERGRPRYTRSGVTRSFSFVSQGRAPPPQYDEEADR